MRDERKSGIRKWGSGWHLYYEDVKNAADRAKARTNQFNARMGYGTNRAYLLWCFINKARGKLGTAISNMFHNRRVK